MFKYHTQNIALLSLAGVLMPSFVLAADAISMIDGITDVVITIIPIIVGLAVLVFFWGIVKFIYHAGDEKAVEEGKMLMVWGLIVIFVMFALWGILGYFQYQLGLDVDTSSLGGFSEQPDTVPVPS